MQVFDSRRSVILIPLMLITIGLVSGYLGMHKTYALIIIIGVIGLFFILSKKYILLSGICLIFSILPFSLNVRGSTDIQIYYGLILLFCFVIAQSNSKKQIIGKAKPNILLLLFLGVVAINYFRNPGLPQMITGHSSENQIKFGVYFLTSLTFISGYLIFPYIIKDYQKIHEFIKIIAIFATIGFLFAWLYFIFDIESPFIPGYGGKIIEIETQSGITTRFGWIGNYSIYLLPIVLVFINPKYKVIKILITGIFLISIMYSGGRAQLIVYIMSILAYFSLKRHSIKPLIIGSFLIVSIYGILSITRVFEKIPVLARFSIDYSLQEIGLRQNDLTTSRFGVMGISLNMVKNYPIFGMGPATDSEVQFLKTNYWNGAYYEAREGTHAMFFNIAAIYGLPALLIYFAAVIKSFTRSIYILKNTIEPKIYRLTMWAIIVLFGFLVGGLFSGSAYGGNLYIFMTLGLIDVLWGSCSLKSTMYKETATSG